MEFADKYISEKENKSNPDVKKIILSNDAYAVGEMLQNLINKLEHMRLQFLK